MVGTRRDRCGTISNNLEQRGFSCLIVGDGGWWLWGSGFPEAQFVDSRAFPFTACPCHCRSELLFCANRKFCESRRYRRFARP